MKLIGEIMMLNFLLEKNKGGFWAPLFLLLMMFANTTTAQTFEFDYQLGAGDKISIRVFGEEDLSLDILVANSGVLNYPFLGELKVVGLTIAELEKSIDSGLRGDYLINPNVNVSITEYRPFFIQGQVMQPGAYPFQPGLNVSKAITVASGFTERAARKKLSIIRANDSSQSERDVKLSDQVRPGDMIVVHESFF